MRLLLQLQGTGELLFAAEEVAPIDMCSKVCKILHMATNLAIDPELLQTALEAGGEKTKKATVTRALNEFIARRKQKRIAELFGTLQWNAEYDYKAERSR